jgi:hypothetical protein
MIVQMRNRSLLLQPHKNNVAVMFEFILGIFSPFISHGKPISDARSELRGS